MARQRLGQHFLEDAGWGEEIARAIRLSPDSIGPMPSGQPADFCWLEIGPGHGEMTEHLVRTGAPVIAIELDASLANGLRRMEKQFPNLKVVAGDILTSDMAKLAAGRNVRVYGN